MKITKITEVAELGTFSNFTWNDQKCSEFKQYNFIYGWNYSGKTTLSRLFRCLECGKPHPNYPGMRFKIETDDKKTITEKNVRDGAGLLPKI